MRSLFFFIILSLFLSAAWAVDPSTRARLEALEGKLRLGMEIEVSNTALSNLVDYFEPQSGVNTKILILKEDSDYLTRDYVTDEAAFNSLPENIRAQLSQGLNLKQSLIIKPDLNAQSTTLEQTPSVQKISIVHPGDHLPRTQSGIITSSRPAPPEKTTEIIPARRADGITDWQLLNAAWNQLPLSERQQLVKYEHLSKRRKAAIIEKEPEYFQIEKDAPSFLKNVTFGLDRAKNFEFRHDENVSITSPQDFLNQVKEFVKKTGIESEVLRNDLATRNSASLHIHISLPPGNPDRDLSAVGKELTRWITFKTLSRGDMSMLNSDDYNGYQSGPLQEDDRRSVIRKISKRHVELRAPVLDLETELPYILEALANPDEKASLLRIKSDTVQMINDDSFQSIIKYAGTQKIAAELLQGSRYEELQQASMNLKRLPVAQYEQQLELAAKNAGLNWDKLKSTPTIDEGRLRSPDSQSPQNIENTVPLLLSFIQKRQILAPNFVSVYGSLMDRPDVAAQVVTVLRRTGWPSVSDWLGYNGVPHLTQQLHDELTKAYLAKDPLVQQWGHTLLDQMSNYADRTHFELAKRLLESPLRNDRGKGLNHLSGFLTSNDPALADEAFAYLKNAHLSQADLLGVLSIHSRRPAWRATELFADSIPEGNLHVAEKVFELLNEKQALGMHEEVMKILISKNSGIHRNAFEAWLGEMEKSHVDGTNVFHARRAMRAFDILTEYYKCAAHHLAHDIDQAIKEK